MMRTESPNKKIIQTSQNIATLSPTRDDLSVIKVKNLLKPKRTNFCAQCRVSKLCITADIDKTTLRKLDNLRFTSRTLSPGETLCQQGQLQNHLYAVRSGVLKSYVNQADGKEFVLGFYLPSEIFGLEGLDDEHLSTTIVALDHCNVCEIPLENWEQLVGQIPGLGIQLLRMVSQKIRFDNYKVLKTTVEQRVANFLLQLTNFYQKLGFPNYLCQLPMPHLDIANYLRIAPETISRTFRQLQKKEVIRVSKSSKRKIYITDFNQLKSLANV